jgi:hypothetical protein
MTRKDFDRQWLAISLVALMTEVRVSDIGNWSKRNLVEGFDQKPGRNAARRYSLAQMVFLKGMDIAVKQGAKPEFATHLGRALRDYLWDRFNHKWTFPKREKVNVREDNDDNLLLYGFTWSGTFVSAIVPHYVERSGKAEGWKPIDYEQMQREIDIAARAAKGGPVHSFSVIDADHLLAGLFVRYEETDPEMNELALQGRLKPFPKSLR